VSHCFLVQARRRRRPAAIVRMLLIVQTSVIVSLVCGRPAGPRFVDVGVHGRIKFCEEVPVERSPRKEDIV